MCTKETDMTEINSQTTRKALGKVGSTRVMLIYVLSIMGQTDWLEKRLKGKGLKVTHTLLLMHKFSENMFFNGTLHWNHVL